MEKDNNRKEIFSSSHLLESRCTNRINRTGAVSQPLDRSYSLVLGSCLDAGVPRPAHELPAHHGESAHSVLVFRQQGVLLFNRVASAGCASV